jgi:hypothetical protein
MSLHDAISFKEMQGTIIYDGSKNTENITEKYGYAYSR